MWENHMYYVTIEDDELIRVIKYSYGVPRVGMVFTKMPMYLKNGGTTWH